MRSATRLARSTAYRKWYFSRAFELVIEDERVLFQLHNAVRRQYAMLRASWEDRAVAQWDRHLLLDTSTDRQRVEVPVECSDVPGTTEARSAPTGQKENSLASIKRTRWVAGR